MEAAAHKPVILYAEDDLDDFDALNEALTQETSRFRLLWAKNGEEAIQYLQDENSVQPSLIVLDLNMPIMNGKQTLQWIKADDRFKDIPVMIFTTSSREEDVRLCQSYRCTFFRKPTLYRDLLHIVQIMIGMCELETVKKTE